MKSRPTMRKPIVTMMTVMMSKRPPSTASKTTISGLESGVEYAFRVAAVGAAGQGPWSDESVKRVP